MCPCGYCSGSEQLYAQQWIVRRFPNCVISSSLTSVGTVSPEGHLEQRVAQQADSACSVGYLDHSWRGPLSQRIVCLQGNDNVYKLCCHTP